MTDPRTLAQREGAFRTPDEWRRAREAHLAIVQMFASTLTGKERATHERLWDAKFPCPPEPDRAEVEAAVDVMLQSFEEWSGYDAAIARIKQSGMIYSSEPNRHELYERFAAFRAAVLARMQPQGEVHEVQRGYCCDDEGIVIQLSNTSMADYPGPFKVGTRVRVTKVEGEA